MDTSIFLARLLGIMLIILYVGVLKNVHLYRGYIKSVETHPILLFISGFMGLLLGLLMVLVHNIWTVDWRVLITIFGWILVISGTFRILFPDIAIKLSQKVLTMSQKVMSVTCIILCLIGLFLAYKGFAT